MPYAYKGFCHETDAIALQKFVYANFPYIENGRAINYQSATSTAAGVFNLQLEVSENSSVSYRTQTVSFVECEPFPDTEMLQALGVSFSVGFVIVATLGLASHKIGLIVKSIKR